MEKETGGPAFPTPATEWHGNDEGMTLRDHFAGLAMQGILSDPDAGLLDDDLKRYAGVAYRAADALLRARSE